MKKIQNWVIGGEAGYGILSVGQLFAKSCRKHGFYCLGHSEVPSLIRGGHNTFAVRFSNERVIAPATDIDLLVALNKKAIDESINQMATSGSIIYDNEKLNITKKENVNYIGIPIEKFAIEFGGNKIMSNIVALGASYAIFNFDIKILKKLIAEVLGRKGTHIVEKNYIAAKQAYTYIKNTYPKLIYKKIKGTENLENMIISGNEAVALGSIKAGCNFLSAYPMTPASTIMQTYARHARDYNLIMKQTEDEIAAMNMAIGAGFAGVRAMTATSGGGFALMTEALGLAAMIEVPVVIVDVQRPGPSTGLPTRSGQGDLRFVLHASQDDFPRIVVIPGDVEECFEYSFELHNLAEKYQCPAILLSDKYLGMSMFSCEKFKHKNKKINRGKLLLAKETDKNFARYKYTTSGISPRSIPGQKGGEYIATSDEHDIYGDLDEAIETRTKMTEKRWKKLINFQAKLPSYKLHGPAKADITFIACGSPKGAVLEAIEILKKQKIKANFLQIIILNPFTIEIKKILKKANKLICVEENISGQLESLIIEKTLIRCDQSIRNYNGRPITASQIINKI